MQPILQISIAGVYCSQYLSVSSSTDIKLIEADITSRIIINNTLDLGLMFSYLWERRLQKTFIMGRYAISICKADEHALTYGESKPCIFRFSPTLNDVQKNLEKAIPLSKMIHRAQVLYTTL